MCPSFFAGANGNTRDAFLEFVVLLVFFCEICRERGGDMADQQNDFVSQMLETVGSYFVSLAMDDYEEKDACLCRLGDIGHLKILDQKGEVAFHVVGNDSVELGEELGLACFHNLSIEHLGALHLHPLNKPLHLPRAKKD
jgi:hypothetical protein